MDQLTEKLKSQKLRLTEARKAIYNILDQCDQALSAREICDRVNLSPSIKTDQASVYRNLSLFSKIGVTHSLSNGKYSLCKHNTSDSHKHVHIVANCTKCGKFFEPQKHQKGLCEITNRFKGFIDEIKALSTITLHGECKKCSTKTSKK